MPVMFGKIFHRQFYCGQRRDQQQFYSYSTNTIDSEGDQRSLNVAVNLERKHSVLQLFKDALRIKKETLSCEDYKKERRAIYETFRNQPFDATEFKEAKEACERVKSFRIDKAYPSPTKEYWDKYYSTISTIDKKTSSMDPNAEKKNFSSYMQGAGEPYTSEGLPVIFDWYCQYDTVKRFIQDSLVIMKKKKTLKQGKKAKNRQREKTSIEASSVAIEQMFKDILVIGNGLSDCAVSMKTPDNKVTAIDISVVASQFMQEKYGKSTGVQFLCMDVLQMPFKDQFDFVFDKGLMDSFWKAPQLMDIRGMKHLVKKVHEALKPGGVWMIFTLFNLNDVSLRLFKGKTAQKMWVNPIHRAGFDINEEFKVRVYRLAKKQSNLHQQHSTLKNPINNNNNDMSAISSTSKKVNKHRRKLSKKKKKFVHDSIKTVTID